MSTAVEFDYSPKSIAFLEERIDEDSAYSKATRIFEYFVRRKPKIGDPIDRPPLVWRRFVVIIPKLKPLAFYYWIGGKMITVFLIEPADQTPA